MREPKTPSLTTFYKPEEWPYVKSDGSAATLFGGVAEGPYVESGLERTILRRLKSAVEEAEKGEGAVVLLRGFKGVGKSAAAAMAVHMLLQDGNVAVIDVDVSVDVDEQSLATAFAEVKRLGRIPVTFIDVNRLEFYSGTWKVKLDALPSLLTKVVATAKREGVALLVIDDIAYTWVGGPSSDRAYKIFGVIPRGRVLTQRTLRVSKLWKERHQMSFVT